MKIKRYKKSKKILGFYINNFGFHEPYQVLVDGTFAKSARENKVQIAEQLPQYLQGKLKLLTTPCVITEMDELSRQAPALKSAFYILKQFGVHKCSHVSKTPVTGSECLLSMVGTKNKSRYIIATQDKLLQEKIVNLPGVPLLYLHGQVPTIKSPSQASRMFADNSLKKATSISGEQEKTLTVMKVKYGLESEAVLLNKKFKKQGPSFKGFKKQGKRNDNVNASKNNVKDSGKVHKKKKKKIVSKLKEAVKTCV